MKLLVLGLSLCFFSSTWAAAPNLKPFSLRLEVPSKSETCDLLANEIGNRFTFQTGVGSRYACTGSRTIGSNETVYTIVLSYLAENEILPTQAIFGGSDSLGNPLSNIAVFATYSDCLAQQNVQEVNFQKETGLPVFVSYCEAASAGFDQGYSLTVEGFGKAQRQLHIYSNVYSYSANDSSVLTGVMKAIASSGGDIVLNIKGQVFYYSEYNIHVTVSDVARVASESECQQQGSSLQSIATSESMNGLTVLCTGKTPDIYITLVGVGGLSEPDSPEAIPTDYFSFADCMADRARVGQNLSSDGAKVLGEICGKSDDNKSYRMDVYLKNI